MKKITPTAPAMRFRGFTDDWEQRKLFDCISKITDFRGRTPKKLGMDWSEEGHLALSALNVKDGYIDFSQDVHYGDDALYQKWMAGNELHKGQVLFTTEAPMGNVAQVPDNKQYILSQRTIAFTAKDNILCENFLATMLRSPLVKKHLEALQSGGTAKGVSQKSLASVEIMIPKELKEQQLLASVFMNLDNLITLHQRKLDQQKQLKKYFLQNMLPAKGEKVPKIRFQGFSGDWEQRKLGDEAIEIIAGGDVDKSKLLERGKYPVIANALTNDGIVGYYENDYRIKAPAVTVTGRGDVGHAQARKFNFTPVVRLLAVYSNHDVDFLAEAINQCDVVLESTGVPQLTVPKLANYCICFPPTFDEEVQIGAYLYKLDHLITLQQHKIDQLQAVKKFMLQNMFI